jgi:hypothetical protein
MPLTTSDTASIVIIQQELMNMMVSIAEITRTLQGIGDAPVQQGGTLDFSDAQETALIAAIAA